MDMNRIRYFSVLVEQRHVRKAAEVLGMNPASISKAVKILEREVGFKLTIPSGRGIEITDQGLLLYRQCRGLLDEFNAVQSVVRDRSVAEVKSLRLGSMEVFTTYFLAKFMSREQLKHRMRVHYLSPGKIEESLKLREIDLGITYIRIPDSELEYVRIGEFRMKLFGHKKMVGLPLENLPFAVPTTGINTPTLSLPSLDSWPSEKFPRKIVYELELLETAVQFARMGLAVVYCPDFVGRFHNELVPSELRLHEMNLPPGFKVKALPIYIVQRKNESETVFVRKLARLARSLS